MTRKCVKRASPKRRSAKGERAANDKAFQIAKNTPKAKLLQKARSLGIDLERALRRLERAVRNNNESAARKR